jgi:hypothetical protein
LKRSHRFCGTVLVLILVLYISTEVDSTESVAIPWLSLSIINVPHPVTKSILRFVTKVLDLISQTPFVFCFGVRKLLLTASILLPICTLNNLQVSQLPFARRGASTCSTYSNIRPRIVRNVEVGRHILHPAYEWQSDNPNSQELWREDRER